MGESRGEYRDDHDRAIDAAGNQQGRGEAAITRSGIEAEDAAGSIAHLGSDGGIERASSATEEIFGNGYGQLVGIQRLHSSGPIPDAISLQEYPPEVQRRIIEWREREVKALFDDESRRQDLLVNAAINQSRRNSAFSFIVNISIAAGAIIAFVVTGNPNSFWAFAIPGVTAIGNVVIDLSKKSAGNSDTENRHDDSGKE